MIDIDVHDALTPASRDDAVALVGIVEAATGRRPLSDQLWLELTGGAPLAVQARQDNSLIGHAQLGRTNDAWSLEIVVHPEVPADDRQQLTATLVSRAKSAVAQHGGGTVYWWVGDVDPAAQQLAATLGVRAGRTLHQMRVPLPLDASIVDAAHLADVPVRSFTIGADDDAWLEVNNAAFADHAEQGGWTREDLVQRQREPWFDVDGFLLHERDHRLAAFCWTKIHQPSPGEPMQLGEIYVIAVHPDFHGLGLGRALTVAGLVSIGQRGVRTGMLYVDGDNVAAVGLYRALGFTVHRTDQAFVLDVDPVELPTWDVTDVHPSLSSRSFTDALEAMGSDVDRLEALFDDVGIRAAQTRAATQDDADTAATALRAYNAAAAQLSVLEAYVYSTVSTDSRNEQAQALLSEIATRDARMRPLLARFAEWVHALGPHELAALDDEVADHLGPLQRLSERADHQMNESEEGLYAELATTGSSAWSRLQRDVTSQLTTDVALPDGDRRMPMPAVRGLATDPDPAVRRAAYDAEMHAWPQIATTCAAAMNAIKGEANTVNRRRAWASPLDASLFANSVSRPTFDAMQAAITDSLPRFREWMRTKARLHGHQGSLPWWDLVAPLPVASGRISWNEGIGLVRDAFTSFSPSLAGVVDRAVDERWLDAAPRDGKTGGAFCMPFVGDRSLVLLNWSGSAESAQTTAHELGHAYHNVQLAQRTALQRRVPMALAETASIFCETLVVEAGLEHLEGPDRLALLDVDLQGSNQVVVDIRSRFLFETEVFARRQRRTLGVTELNEMMQTAQADAYGDGLDQSTAHPHMWLLKPHYYGSHFYNWPYTYGLLFGLGLFAQYRADPERFLAGYDDLLSRAGMNTAEELGDAFGIDVTGQAFWTASLNVIESRIDQYATLAADLGLV
jgi:oligoendopeptidase F